MKSEIDFESYTLEDLYDSARHIDRERFSERAAYIDRLIVEKENSLPTTVSLPTTASGRYPCNRNYLNLLNGCLLLCLTALMMYWLYFWDAWDSKFEILHYVFVFGAAICFFFSAFKCIRVYLKLDGVERFIEINNGVLSMPRNSFSLKQVDIPINDIHELYYRSIRRSFGAVSSLEIIYGNGKTASIAVAYLSKHDFDAVCDQLKGMLNLGKIKTKYT